MNKNCRLSACALKATLYLQEEADKAQEGEAERARQAERKQQEERARKAQELEEAKKKEAAAAVCVHTYFYVRVRVWRMSNGCLTFEKIRRFCLLAGARLTMKPAGCAGRLVTAGPFFDEDE